LPAAPPPTITTDRGVPPGAAAGRRAALSRFSLTKALPSRCSTRQQETGFSAGARSASPVRRLKQA
jgi:hypothetical protein